MDAISKTELALDLRRIPMAAIKAGPAIQQRVNGTSEEVVAEYAQAMRAGDKFPPLDVFSKDDGTFHLADGFHRFEAHRRRNEDGEQEIECRVHHGNRDDALFFACGANAGLRRGPSDQRKAIASLLGIRPEWSDREIARRCKVSPTLVAKVRKVHLQTAFIDGGRKEERAEGTAPARDRAAAEATAIAPDRRRTVMRGGKPYRMQTARIGGGRAAARSRKRSEPRSALESLAWSTATPQERVAFVKGVGRRGIEDAFNAIEPGFDTLNRAWEAAKQPERQAFARENHDEIIELAEAPVPVTAAERSANAIRPATSPEDDPLAIPTCLRRGHPTALLTYK
jgi:hypothetical protein